jgi:hypothetical protein
VKKTGIAIAAVAAFWTVNASAQSAVRPHFDYSGSAVCPEGFDYFQGLCRARGGRYGYDRHGYGGGVPARFTRSGSAVCPEGYDYKIRINGCVPQRY